MTFKNTYAAWFTGTSLCDVKHPVYGGHQLTPHQIKYSDGDYKSALWACIKRNLDAGHITGKEA